MISQVLDYTKKYYPYSLETGTFEIVPDGIQATFNESYLVGQYVNIQNSRLNDGTYKITGVTASKITLDATLLTETTYMCIWGLQLPSGLLSLITDIETYTNSQSTKANIASESQGNRSVTYGGVGSTWQSTFKPQLSQYRSMYDDRRTFCRKYNINSKG